MLKHRDVLQHIDEEFPLVSRLTLTLTQSIMVPFNPLKSRGRFVELQSGLEAKHCAAALTYVSGEPHQVKVS